jgi:ATP-dependent helicase/DNAse subunit B
MPPSFPLVFARYRDIASQVASRLRDSRTGDALAPWSCEVIAASGGMADAIARELGAAAGLRLQSIDELARRIVNARGELPRVATDAERRLAMRTAVRSIDDPLTTSRGIAAMLERAYRDVRDSGLTLAHFRERARRAPLRNRERTTLIIRAWTEYERLITSLHAIDPADLLGRAAADVSAAVPQIVAGFYDMTGAQLALVEALANEGKIVAFYMPLVRRGLQSARYAFAQPLISRLAHASFVGDDPSLEIRQPVIETREFDLRDSEIRATCASIAELLANGAAPRDIGIVTRALDDFDVYLFRRYAADAGFAVSRSESTPLRSHRLGRALASLLRIRERNFRRGEVLELVRDGLRFDARVDVDRADAETRRHRIAGGTGEELRGARRRPSAVIDDYVQLVAEVESLAPAGAMRGRDWSAWLTSIAARLKFEAEVDLRAAECVDAIADLFRRADAMRTMFDLASVLDAIESESIDAPTPQNAVWLGDVMKFRGRTFEHVFAVRVQDDVFPQRRTEDPLLPDSDRRAIGVREIGDGRDEERLLFQLLTDGTSSSLTLSYSVTDGFGKVLRRSQFVGGSDVPTLRGSEEKTSRPRNLATSQPLSNSATQQRPLQLLAQAGTNSPFDGFIADESLRAKFAERLTSISPTSLEDFGECPQKFLLKHLLDVRDVDDPERELQIDHREKGSIDHRILERFYRSLTDDDYAAAQAALPRLPEELSERLERAIDTEFDHSAEEAPPYNANIRAIERRATKRILREFVARDLADIFETGLKPKYFEYRFGKKYPDGEHPQSFVVSASGVDIRIDGRIDRIDSDGARVRIIDYKSGKALRHVGLAEKIERGVRLQLAVYAMAIAEFLSLDPANVAGAIKPIVSGEQKPQTFAFVLASSQAALQETLDIFARAIISGRFPAFPKENDFGSCKYCPVNHSCRTKHDAEERYAVGRAGEPRTLLRQIEERA